MEYVYILTIFIFLLLLSMNLTIQLLTIYHTEKRLQFLRLMINDIHGNESLTYVLSKIYIRKCQWINAIWILQKNLKHKQLYDLNNIHSLTNLNSNIGCIFNQLNKIVVAKYYLKKAINFDS